MTAGLLEIALSAFIDVAKTWDEFEKFIPNLQSFQKTWLQQVTKTYTTNTSDFAYNVLNHADFHLKNIMFKKSADGSVEDFYIVSWFTFRWLDILIFFSSDWLSTL